MMRTIQLMILIFVATTAPSVAQFQFIHPPQITSDDFRQPPATAGVFWDGPHIGKFGDAACWHAEPEEPTKAIGGSDEWQSVVGFIPIPVGLDVADYRQMDLHGFSGGGGKTDLAPADLPAGVYLSFAAHPVFQIQSVKFPASRLLSRDSGILIKADFLAARSMGECYFYGAAWIARPTQ